MRISVLVLASVAAACLACSPRPPQPAPRSATASAEAKLGGTWVEDRLFLGRGIPGGDSVTEAEWADFLRDRVTPRFPDGLTVYRATGQWMRPDRTVEREGSFVLDLLHPASTAADSAVLVVAAEYRARFRQRSVMRVTTPAAVRFVEAGEDPPPPPRP